MPFPEPPVIHWFRRDLRIADNTAFREATRSGKPVIAVYVLSEWKAEHHWTGPNRQKFLCDSLAELAASLRKLGGSLVIRQGHATAELKKLIRETQAAALYFNRDPDPYGKEIEDQLRDFCRQAEVEFSPWDDVALHSPCEVLTKSSQPYRVFTPYSRNWLDLPKPEPLGSPRKIQRFRKKIASLPLPALKTWRLAEPASGILPGGETAARKRLGQAIARIVPYYAGRRDCPAEEGTSRISQDLRHGLISIRTVYARVMKARAGAKPKSRHHFDVFIKELAWREFYFAILHHFPNVLAEEFNETWRGLPWDEPGERFEAWNAGKTGFPIVDAGMRQLLATGFMHNRVRMITAMFLTKDLHLDWRLGESWFMQQLVDGEIASNNGGWQWSAGTGADAAPYFRIQNPWTQTAKYDPEGSYIKRWVPELADVPAARLMTPPKDGKPIAEGYPAPIVDHKTEREKTLNIFKRHRSRRTLG